jgi:molecular chaperone DnaK (HSP70)
MIPLIPRNTIILTKKIQIWTTYLDNKTDFNMKVFEGEYPMALISMEF